MTQTASGVGPDEAERSTHFLFEHKVFTLQGARFALTEDGSTPAFQFELGALIVSLPLGTLRGEFGIDCESVDDTLLAIVEKSLRFVKDIRPGDSIPRELLDGTASWTVEDRHRSRAKAQLWARAIRTDEISGATDEAIEAFLARPETVTALEAASQEIAAQLGRAMTGPSVLARVDDLARELAYIEALRERCGDVLNIVPKVSQLSRVYRSDRAIVDELSRIRTLMLKPIELYDGIFARLAQRQEKIAEAVRYVHERIEFIREQRDDLHQSMMLWDPILAAWKLIEMTRCTETESKITDLYRFIARHYLAAQSWQQDTA